MRKFKKMLLGMALAMGVFAGSVGSCYAAANDVKVELTADITAIRAYGKLVYNEAGHQIKVTVYYQEKNSDGLVRGDHVSDVQFGNVVTAVASKNNSSGYQFIWGNVFGEVDNYIVATSGDIYVK